MIRVKRYANIGDTRLVRVLHAPVDLMDWLHWRLFPDHAFRRVMRRILEEDL